MKNLNKTSGINKIFQPSIGEYNNKSKMKNILKRNSRKVNVSDCGTLDCYEKQTEKEVEIYKPISEDTTPKEDCLEVKSDNKGKF